MAGGIGGRAMDVGFRSTAIKPPGGQGSRARGRGSPWAQGKPTHWAMGGRSWGEWAQQAVASCSYAAGVPGGNLGRPLLAARAMTAGASRPPKARRQV